MEFPSVFSIHTRFLFIWNFFHFLLVNLIYLYLELLHLLWFSHRRWYGPILAYAWSSFITITPWHDKWRLWGKLDHITTFLLFMTCLCEASHYTLRGRLAAILNYLILLANHHGTLRLVGETTSIDPTSLPAIHHWWGSATIIRGLNLWLSML